MKRLIYTFIFLFVFSLNALAYQDSKVTADNYNKQGALALSNGLKAQKGERRFFLKEAKWFYKKSIEVYPDNFEAFLGLARSYMYLGRFDKSYNNFMVAYNFDDKNVLVNYYLGEYNFLNEQYLSALSYYKLALKYGYFNHYDTNYKIALCYDKLADSRQAIKFYKKALEINPDAKEPKEKISEIENKDAKYKDYYEFYDK